MTIDLTFLTGQEALAVRLVQRILECRTGPWHTDPAQWHAIEQALDDTGSTGEDTFVELFGLVEDSNHDEKVERKLKLVKKRQLKLISAVSSGVDTKNKVPIHVK